MAGIQVDKEALQAKGREIQELDVVLDAQSGSKAAGKRSVRNRLVAESGNSEFVNAVVYRMREDFSEEELYATFYALLDGLDNDFSDEAEQHVDSLVEAQQSDNFEKLSDDEIQKIQAERKDKVNEFKALANILEMFGTDISDVSEPKIRRGSRGPRGPRTLSKFQYTINETELEEEVNSLATVAKLSGVKVKELKEHITSQGVDLKNPPAEWTAELPNDVGTLTATPLPDFVDEFGDDESDEDAA